ncbi:MAG: multicopper oxidase domain-containing protein [Dermatophilus congolensis]|nr:multicopper oxidase domain-containing protein [Dermatophilus congolensis]
MPENLSAVLDRAAVIDQEYANLAQTGSAPPLPVSLLRGESPPPTVPPATEVVPVTEVETVGEAPDSADGGPEDVGAAHVQVRAARVGEAGVASGLGLRKFRDRLRVPRVIQAWRDPETPVVIRAMPGRVRFHRDLPTVDAWTYEGSVPGPTIEVKRGRRTYVDWRNDLFAGGAAAPLPFDVVRVPPLPPGTPGFNADFVTAMRPGGHSTSRGAGEHAYPPLAASEDLRAATVVHLHGALTNGHDDGWAHNVATPGGVTRCTYPNLQEAATLWYHDHAMAVTRFNVHAGLAGFYLIRDDEEARLGLPAGAYEVPLLISDRNLESVPRDAVDTFTGRLLYKHAGFSLSPDGPPGEIPITGPFNLVNGTIWPTLPVQPRWYRFRLLNGAGSRIMRLAIHDTTDEKLVPGTAVASDDPAFAANRQTGAIVVIGTEGGLLPAPAVPEGGVIEIGPGERLDILVDFAAYRGRTLELRNESDSVLNAQPGSADATVMQFTVGSKRVRDRFTLPSRLSRQYRRYEHLADGTLRVGDRLIHEHEHAWIGVVPPGIRGSLHPELWELEPVPPGASVPDRDAVQLMRPDGTLLTLRTVAKLFDDPTTIFLAKGSWAVWNILHLGGPNHPMHIHMTEFQMIARTQWPITRPGGAVPEFDLTSGTTTSPLPIATPGRPIDAITQGMKDTWVVQAGEWVQVLGHFEGASGSFMYHCHILDHEDHTMMRPFVVLPKELMAFHRGHGPGHH